MQIMKCQDLAPRFLYLRNLLILGYSTYVLFEIAACIEGGWSYLIEISFVWFLMTCLALFRHLMVTFTHARLVERNWRKIVSPCQAVCKMVEVCELIKEFRDIRRLERVLVARRLVCLKRSISCRKVSVSIQSWKVHYVTYQ